MNFINIFIIISPQFYRSFPGPADITPVELSTLAQKYHDPATDLYNYIKFHDDLVKCGLSEAEVSGTLLPFPSAPLQVRQLIIVQNEPWFYYFFFFLETTGHWSEWNISSN